MFEPTQFNTLGLNDNDHAGRVSSDAAARLLGDGLSHRLELATGCDDCHAVVRRGTHQGPGDMSLDAPPSPPQRSTQRATTR